jgi:hypothetical protein
MQIWIVSKVLIFLKQLAKDLKDFFSNERKWPFEDINEIGKDIRVLAVIELLYVQLVVLEFDDCPFVLIEVTVIWGWEDCYDTWEVLASPIVHFESIELNLVGSY